MSEHVGDLLSAYVDGQLEDAELKEVEEHLASCGACQQELDEISGSRTAVASLGLLEAPLGFFVPGYKSYSKARLVLTIAAAAAAVAIFCATVAIPTSVRESVNAEKLIDMHLTSATSIDPEQRMGNHRSPYQQPARLNGGYVQENEWHQIEVDNLHVVEANYSNGRYQLSVYEHDIPMPAVDGEAKVEYVMIGSHRARVVHFPNQTLITWKDGDVAISVVCDRKVGDAVKVAKDLASNGDAPELTQHVSHSSHRMMNALSGQ